MLYNVLNPFNVVIIVVIGLSDRFGQTNIKEINF